MNQDDNIGSNNGYGNYFNFSWISGHIVRFNHDGSVTPIIQSNIHYPRIESVEIEPLTKGSIRMIIPLAGANEFDQVVIN